MMKHNMKKIISLVLVLAMSFAISVPGFAAEKQAIQKPQVQTVSIKAMASGYIYGPWFGNGNEVWNVDVKDFSQIVSLVANGIAIYVPYASAKKLAGSIGLAAGAYAHYGDPAVTYGTIKKTYREVKYSDGTFAYFESHYVVHTYLIDGKGNTHDLGVTEESYKGTYPMVVNQ